MESLQRSFKKDSKKDKMKILSLFKSILVSLTFAVIIISCDDNNEDISPTENAPTFIDLIGENVYPEGILTRENGDIFVGGFGDGSIQLIENGIDVRLFNPSGENGMVIAVGMAIDERTNRLWVANFNFDTGEGIPGSQMKVFNVNTGELVATIPEDFIPGVFFNEVAINDNGDVFISDTFNPQIWKANADLSGVEVLVNDDLLSNPAPDQPFDLNGLAITPDNQYLIASVMDRLDAGDGKLVRINLNDSTVSPVVLNGDAAVNAFAGSDGMFFHNDQLFMVNVFSSAGAIITADFNGDFSSAELVIRDRFQEVYNRPTASDVRDGRLWTVNSQLDHIIDDNNGAVGTEPQRPFQVVNVSLNDLLEKN
jgi:hypothetical protein